MKKKITLYKHFKKFFKSSKTKAKVPKDYKRIDETFLSEDVEMIGNNDDDNPIVIVSKFMNKVENGSPGLHIVKCYRTKQALIFKLSDS
jgi:hypothetical protein